MENRTLNTLKNIKYGFLSQFTNIILNFVSRTIFINVLGISFLGINGLFTDLLAVLSLADLGFNTAIVYSLYKPIAEEDIERIAALISFYRIIFYALGFIISILGLILLPFIKYFVILDEPINYLELYYLTFLLNSVISYFNVYKSTIITANQKGFVLSKIQLKITITRTITQIFLLLITRSFFIYLLVQTTSILLYSIFISKTASRMYPFINRNSKSLSKIDIQEILSNMKSMALYKVSMVIFGGTDNVIISLTSGTIWVGLYSNYNLIVGTIQGFFNIFYMSMTASIGNMLVLEKSERRHLIFISIQTLSLMMVSVITTCVYLLINDFIRIWIGKTYVLNNIVLVAIVLNFYITGIVQPIWSYREASGLYKKTKYIMLIAALENIFLSIILGYNFGVAGVLFATAISRLTTYFWYEPKLLYKDYFSKPVSQYYIAILENVLITILMSIFFAVLFREYYVSSVFDWLFKGFLIFVSESILMLIIYSRKPGFRQLSSKIKAFF